MYKSKIIIIMIFICLFVSKTNCFSQSREDLINENLKIQNNLNYLLSEMGSTHTLDDNKFIDNLIIKLKVQKNINDKIIKNWPSENQSCDNNSDINMESNLDNNNLNALYDQTVINAVSVQYELMEQKKTEIAKLVKDVIYIREKIAEMKKGLIGLNKENIDKNQYYHINFIIHKLQENIDKKNQLINKETNELSAINKTMQDVLENAEKIGDPVDVTTGEYLSEYIDFTAQDFLDRFFIKRFYKYNNKKENFGLNWFSTLDSRIVRCNYNDMTDLIKETKDLIFKYENILNECKAFRSQFNTYTYDIITYQNEAIQKLQYYKEELHNLIKLENTRKQIVKLNESVAYGRYDSLESHFGYENNLIFLDENGFEHFFKYEGNGIWKDLRGKKSLFLELRSLDKNGQCSDTNFPEGGYILIYKSGEKILFSASGIRIKKIDRNENETIFNVIDGKINEIILKTGEKLSIKRNEQNFITSIKGPVSGETFFTYADDKLQSVKDNNGIEVFFKYDECNHLIELVKADMSSVKIFYKHCKELNKKLCVGVINENGYEEKFSYDIDNKIVYHDFYGTGSEYYEISYNGKTYRYQNFKQEVTEIIRDNEENIKSIIENGNRKDYFYNSNGLIEQIEFQNGKLEKIKYNDNNQVIEVSDNDGLINRFEYDNKGNLIRSYLGSNCCGEYFYFENGLVSRIIENNIEYSYKYNEFGNILEKNINSPDGTIDFYKWEYNDKNKLIRFYSSFGDEFSYQYGELSETIIEKDKETKRFFNNRGWLISEIIIDLQNKSKNIKEYKYDSVGNILEVYLDGFLFMEYDYYNNGILRSIILWNNPINENLKEGLKIKYLYNQNWNIITEERSRVNKTEGERLESIKYKTYKYTNSGKNTIVTIGQRFKKDIKRTYDHCGRLVRVDYGNNYYIIYNYSKAGRLIQQRDSDFNLYKYIYGNDGSFKIIVENRNGQKSTNFYNTYGQLIKVSNNYGFNYVYEYDYKGNLINVKASNFCIENKFDKKNRIISSWTKDLSGKLVQDYFIKYDDINKQIKVLCENLTIAYEKRDCFNRVVESKSSKGHFFYEYDVIGNCIKVKDIYGNIKINEFSPLGDIIKVVYDNGQEVNYKYDLWGNITGISNKMNEIYSYEIGDNYIIEHIMGAANKRFYNNNMDLEKYDFYDTGVMSITNSEKLILKKDNYNNVYKYELNDKGQIISEENPLGAKQTIEYDNYGAIREIVSFSGVRQINDYNLKENLISFNFNSGEKIEIKKDVLGKITDIISNDYSLHYEYDKRGNLLSEYSKKTNTYIYYKYDEMNRCIEKEGSSFYFIYEYDLMSRLSKVINKFTNDWLEFEYDNQSRILRKTYSNGCISFYSYNENGQIEYMVSRNKLGSIIHGDFICYDDFNRISVIGDRDGNIKKYFYDDKGRVIKTIYPYTKNKENFYKKEAAECGYYIDNKVIKTESSLEIKENNLINKLYEKAGVRYFTNVKYNQKVWVEEYEYDKNGNLISVENPYGTIIYKYDRLNRLISKNYSNTNNDGIKIKWNNDNCIQEYESKLRKITFEYGVQKRPIRIISENIYGDCNVVEYIYDGLGRRVIEKNNDRNIEYIYDGFTTYILTKQYITDNDCVLKNINIQNAQPIKGIGFENKKQYKSASQYRVIDNSDYIAFGNNRDEDFNKNNNFNEHMANNRDQRPFCVLGLNGCPFIISFGNGNNKNSEEINFPITNYSNEIIGFVNRESDLTDIIQYDTWGNVYSDGNTVAYTGAKTQNEHYSFMFNLGMRDYFPLLKSFSTEDPLRQGNNWYSYCSCDPINYEDSFGLTKQACFDIEYLKFNNSLSKFLTFNEDECIMAKLNGEKYMGIPTTYDCADYLAAITYSAFKENSFNNHIIPDIITSFGKSMDNGNDEQARSIFSTADIRAGCAGKLLTRGFDRDYMKKNSNNPEYRKALEFLQERKDRTIEYLKNPNNVRVGDCFIWGNSITPNDTSPEDCGHVALILSIDSDENGLPIGFICFEGHIDRTAELTYISIEPKEGFYTLDDYCGDFQGVRRMFNKNERVVIDGCGK